MWSKDFAIDLGTSKIAIFAKGRGIILNEPSVIAVDSMGAVCGVGRQAQRMLGKTPGNITAVRPLSDGVISDFTLTDKILRIFIKKAIHKSLIKPRLLICIPVNASYVERKAILDAGFAAGGREVYLIDEPMAGAIGAGLNIEKPNGHMVVDIGGGTCDISVISLGQNVSGTSVKVGGNAFDSIITQYLRKNYHLYIGDTTAEQVKCELGSVYPLETEVQMTVKGRSTITGFPETAVISSVEIRRIFEEPMSIIIDAIKSVFEQTPPEIAGDIIYNGITLTGGGALLRGMDKKIQAETGTQTFLAENPRECVIRGCGIALDHFDLIKKLEINQRTSSRFDYEFAEL